MERGARCVERRHGASGGAPASSSVVSRRLVWLGAGLGALSLAAAVLLAARDIAIALIAVPMMTLAFLAALMPGTSGPTRVMWLIDRRAPSP